jgi:hypothetical protein
MVSDQLQNRLQIISKLDTAQISEIVRREQASRGFEIGSWDVRQLSSGGGINPEGLFLFSGDDPLESCALSELPLLIKRSGVRIS